MRPGFVVGLLHPVGDPLASDLVAEGQSALQLEAQLLATGMIWFLQTLHALRGLHIWKALGLWGQER